MNVNKVATQFIDNFNKTIQQAEDLFSKITQKIQDIFNRFISSKTEEQRHQPISETPPSATETIHKTEDCNKKFNDLKTLLERDIIPIEDAFGVHKQSFEKFRANNRDGLYENLEWLKEIEIENLTDLSRIIANMIIREEDSDKKSLMRQFLFQIEEAKKIKYSDDEFKGLMKFEISMDDFSNLP
ncbi:MAG: hypothetical protein K2X08_01105 [Chlamydiales bacterium]|nr:hypothetical protein [Chlamydiales bacterium]